MGFVAECVISYARAAVDTIDRVRWETEPRDLVLRKHDAQAEQAARAFALIRQELARMPEQPTRADVVAALGHAVARALTGGE